MKTTVATIAIAAALAVGTMGCKEKEKAHKAHATGQGEKEAAAARKAAPTRAAVPTEFDAPPKIGTRARCPVMGGEFTVSKETERSTHKGKHYVFCCQGCKPKFDQNPEKFLSGAKGKSKSG